MAKDVSHFLDAQFRKHHVGMAQQLFWDFEDPALSRKTQELLEESLYAVGDEHG